MNVDTLIENLYQTPEVQALDNIVEKNDYHNEASALRHTVYVVQHIKEVIRNINPGLTEEGERHKDYLDEKVGDYTRGDLLQVAAVVHDIGKAMMTINKRTGEKVPVFQTKKDGKTTAIWHDRVAGPRVYEMMKEHGLSEPDAAYVRDVVSYHMSVFHLYNTIEQAKNPQKTLDKARKKAGDLWIDLLTHALADKMGCGHTITDFYDATLQKTDQESKKQWNEINFMCDLMDEAMSVRDRSGDVAQLEREVSQGTVYVAPEHQAYVREQSTAMYTQRMERQVETGHLTSEKAEQVVAKRVDKLMDAVRFSSEIPSGYKEVLEQRPIKYDLKL